MSNIMRAVSSHTKERKKERKKVDSKLTFESTKEITYAEVVKTNKR